MTGVAIKSTIPAAWWLRQELKPVRVSKFQTVRTVSQRQKRSEFNPHHSERNTWRVCTERQTDRRERGEGEGEQTRGKSVTSLRP